MTNISSLTVLVFVATVIFSLWFFYRAAHKSLTLLFVCVCWLLIQGIISWPGFYLVTDTLPPRFLLLVVPPLISIIFIFMTKKGRAFIDGLDERWLTYFHSLRLPVELVLYWLMLQSLVPELMTFEGRNPDIITGITAPFIAYFGYTRAKLGKKFLIGWNLVCLGLLINIVVIAILSAPFPFQQFAFDQPNRGVLMFPFTWLPAFIVPLALFSHIVCLRKLLR